MAPLLPLFKNRPQNSNTGIPFCDIHVLLLQLPIYDHSYKSKKLSIHFCLLPYKSQFLFLRFLQNPIQNEVKVLHLIISYKYVPKVKRGGTMLFHPSTI